MDPILELSQTSIARKRLLRKSGYIDHLFSIVGNFTGGNEHSIDEVIEQIKQAI